MPSPAKRERAGAKAPGEGSLAPTGEDLRRPQWPRQARHDGVKVRPPPRGPMQNAALFVATVLIWGATWIAIKMQVGRGPGARLHLLPLRHRGARLVGGALAVGGKVSASRRAGITPGSSRRRFCLFCMNFVCFYNAAAFITSGLDLGHLLARNRLQRDQRPHLFRRQDHGLARSRRPRSAPWGLALLFGPRPLSSPSTPRPSRASRSPRSARSSSRWATWCHGATAQPGPSARDRQRLGHGLRRDCSCWR